MKGKLEENLLLSQFLSRINFYRFLVNNVEVNSTQDYALMTLAQFPQSVPQLLELMLAVGLSISLVLLSHSSTGMSVVLPSVSIRVEYLL